MDQYCFIYIYITDKNGWERKGQPARLQGLIKTKTLWEKLMADEGRNVGYRKIRYPSGDAWNDENNRKTPTVR